MSNKFSNICIILGAALLTAALSLLIANRLDDARAGKESAAHLELLVAQIEAARQESPAPDTLEDQFPELGRPALPEEGQAPGEDASQTSPQIVTGSSGMKEVDIGGIKYIGYVSIPKLELELPVISQWNYSRLAMAPCRYSGSVQEGDFVILAHNFASHFRNINMLSSGDEVLFTDMEGTVHSYKVVKREILDNMAVDEMTKSGYDLTLFTCTRDSKSRITIRCEKTE